MDRVCSIEWVSTNILGPNTLCSLQAASTNTVALGVLNYYNYMDKAGATNAYYPYFF